MNNTIMYLSQKRAKLPEHINLLYDIIKPIEAGSWMCLKGAYLPTVQLVLMLKNHCKQIYITFYLQYLKTMERLVYQDSFTIVQLGQ